MASACAVDTHTRQLAVPEPLVAQLSVVMDEALEPFLTITRLGVGASDPPTNGCCR
jgi:hypothetical protein